MLKYKCLTGFYLGCINPQRPGNVCVAGTIRRLKDHCVNLEMYSLGCIRNTRTLEMSMTMGQFPQNLHYKVESAQKINSSHMYYNWFNKRTMTVECFWNVNSSFKSSRF